MPECKLVETMMKAQVREEGGSLVLQVCGRVTEGWVAELETCWCNAKASHPNQALSVDLCSVTFIDRSGEELLKRMYREGASFRAAGLLIQEVVKQVTGGAK